MNPSQYAEDESLIKKFLEPKEEDTLDDIREEYRRTFDTDSGRRVLTHMLTELHFFDEKSSEEEVHLSNYAVRILFYLGIVVGENIPTVVSKLLDLISKRR